MIWDGADYTWRNVWTFVPIMVMPGSETSVAAVAVKDWPQIMKFSVWCDYALLLQRGWLQWVMGGDMTWHITRDTWHVTRGTGHGAAFQCWNIIDELEELYHNYLKCALQLKCSNTQLTASNWIMGLGTSSGGKLAHSHANCLKMQKPAQPERIL